MAELRPFEQLPFAAVPERPRLPHRYFEAKLEDVRINTRPYGSLSIRVARFGRGSPIVLVHGFMTTSYSFRYLFEPLGLQHEVVAFDLPGAGDSDKPSGPYDPVSLAQSIADIVRGLGVAGAPMIGNSLGGYLALRVALSEPETIGRLVCLHPPGLPTARMRALRVALDVIPRPDRVVRALVRRDPERWVHKNVHYFDETLKSREEHREYARPLRTEAGISAFFAMLDRTLDVRAMAAFERELTGRAAAFPVPLMLVYARRDPMVPPAIGARFAEIVPSAKLVWLERASHFAHVDAPADFLRAALPFLPFLPSVTPADGAPGRTL